MEHAQPSNDLGWLEQLNVPDALADEDYVYKWDRLSLATFRAVPLADKVCKAYIDFQLQFSVADLVGSAVRVSETQFPVIYHLTSRLSAVVGIRPPTVFLQESPELDAHTCGADEESAIVVVSRALLQAATPRELAFIIGHELGHIRSRHLIYHSMADWASGQLADGVAARIAKSRLPLPNILTEAATQAVYWPLLAWARRSEITADRVGLICAQDLKSSLSAFALITLGSRELAAEINLDAFAEQRATGVGRWSELNRSHPYTPKRLRAAKVFAEGLFYRQLTGAEPRTDGLSSERIDRIVSQILTDDDPACMPDPEAAARRASLMGALTVAWQDHAVSRAERQRLDAVIERLDLTEAERVDADGWLAREVDEEAALKEIGRASRKKYDALAYAFAVLGTDSRAPGMAQERLLRKIAAACELDSDTTDRIISNIFERKAFLFQECSICSCASCATVFGVDDIDCPSCGMPGDSFVVLVSEPHSLCSACSIVFSDDELSACPRCNSEDLRSVTLARSVLPSQWTRLRGEKLPTGLSLPCPYCSKMYTVGDRICRHCQRALTDR